MFSAIAVAFRHGLLCLHVPPGEHGLLAHSSTSTAQVPPDQPFVQAHLKNPAAIVLLLLFESEQAPLLSHGLAAHSSMSTSHVLPDQPVLHVHA